MNIEQGDVRAIDRAQPTHESAAIEGLRLIEKMTSTSPCEICRHAHGMASAALDYRIDGRPPARELATDN